MAAVHQWFHTSLFKSAGSQPAWPPVLENDSYEVKAILQIKKHKTHANIKWIGYDSLQNQWIKPSELRETALNIVKTFLRGKEQ